jgi:esterase
VRLAYHEWGEGEPLLALHGHFGRGRVWAPLAEALPGWRVVAPDQRGHGRTGHARDYGREAYVADAAHLIEALGLAPAVVLGHSLGGVNAYQLAARRPELVRAVIVEDAPAEFGVRPDLDLWDGRRFATLGELRAAVPHPVLWESAVEDEEGWGFRFDPAEINESRRLLAGDHWADWLAGEHPVLLLHGLESDTLPTAMAREMAARRPNTRLVEFPGAGHAIHDDDPEGFALAVASFLAEL